jgi:hypothetical protein
VTTLWTGRCSSRGLAVLGLGLTLVLVAVGAGILIVLNGMSSASGGAWVGWFVAGIGVVVGLLTWHASSLSVRVTEDTMTVAYGPFGRPRRVIDLSQVEDASAVMIDPMQWGGWGYRWNPRAHATAAVIRKGPGIQLEFKDGRRYVVTVDDAVNGAKLTSAALIGAGRA